MDEIKIGAEIVFNITGNHNIGYAKGEKYIGTVLSKDHRSRLYVRTIGMPRVVSEIYMLVRHFVVVCFC